MRALHRRVAAIRYEAGAWPLWRLDRDLHYIAKSLVHKPFCDTHAEAARWAAVADYVASGRWRRPLDGPLRLTAGGDLMWIRDGWSRALSPELAARFAGHDLFVANLETPIDRGRPVRRWAYETLRYNAPPSYLDAVAGAARTVLSLCNNHALDQGPAGLAATRALLDARGVVAVGGTRASERIARCEVRGVALAFVGFTYDINHREGAAPEGVPCVRMGLGVTDWGALGALVREARARPDTVVVALAHWSFEYEFWPDAAMVEDAHRLIAAGVDVVLGHSPHVLQPVELVSINGADPRCPSQVTRPGPAGFGLVAYSLGNLCSIMPTLPCEVGALLHLTVGRIEGQQGLGFADLSATATVTRRGLGASAIGGHTVSLAAFAEGRSAEGHRAHARAMLSSLLDAPQDDGPHPH